jgi:hypothetical protein
MWGGGERKGGGGGEGSAWASSGSLTTAIWSSLSVSFSLLAERPSVNKFVNPDQDQDQDQDQD